MQLEHGQGMEKEQDGNGERSQGQDRPERKKSLMPNELGLMPNLELALGAADEGAATCGFGTSGQSIHQPLTTNSAWLLVDKQIRKRASGRYVIKT